MLRAQVYVGAAIEPLVDFLCSELAAAFRAEGATLPPWRAADAMLSKWRPRRSVDCDMLPPNGSFRVRGVLRWPAHITSTVHHLVLAMSDVQLQGEGSV